MICLNYNKYSQPRLFQLVWNIHVTTLPSKDPKTYNKYTDFDVPINWQIDHLNHYTVQDDYKLKKAKSNNWLSTLNLTQHIKENRPMQDNCLCNKLNYHDHKSSQCNQYQKNKP